MNDSPKPSASAGKSAELPAFPSRMFFDAKDYAPGRDRGKVSDARARSVAELQRRKDQLGVAIAALRISDEYGLITNAFEVLEEVAAALHKDVKTLARLCQNAEARFDDTNPVIEKPVSQPEAGTPGEALAVELQRLGGPLDHGGALGGGLVTVTMNAGSAKPRHYPRSMAEAMSIRTAKLNDDAL